MVRFICVGEANTQQFDRVLNFSHAVCGAGRELSQKSTGHFDQNAIVGAGDLAFVTSRNGRVGTLHRPHDGAFSRVVCSLDFSPTDVAVRRWSSMA